jgi:glycine/D-amino acid oxidase-like deaminating enzyme
MPTRRTLLAGAGLSALAACSPGIRPAGTLSGIDGAPLVPARIAEDDIIRTVVGLRPFRPSGYVVRAERVGDKLLVHNYGHGGGGWTLSWGTAHQAADLAQDAGSREAAVLGSGIIGLTTARLLQDRGWNVTIYARELPPHTTSDIAGASWSPASVFDEAAVTPEFRERVGAALRLSYRHFQNQVGGRYGVYWTSKYQLSDRPFADDSMFFRNADVFPRLRRLAPHEHPFPAPYALHRDVMFMEPPRYLDAIMTDFRLAGGQFLIRGFHTAEEVAALPQPVIFNCTGLGARDLFGDTELTPMKGQLTVLRPQPAVDYCVVYPEIYMFPRRDGILLGGTGERGEWSLEPDPIAAARLFDKHSRFFAAMAAKV